MSKIFKIPFAAQGDRTDVPVEVQADGSVSYTQGYGFDYERDISSDAAAKDIEREKMNSIFNDITSGIGEMQIYGVAKWDVTGKPYPIFAEVYYNNTRWRSLIENNNGEPGVDAGWFAIPLNVIDTIYPIGIVMFFAENKNPNILFPGTTWNYIGEDKTIRLAKADGSDVKTTGGVDSVTLTTANMPSHSHTFTGTASNYDYGTKTSSAFDYGTKTSSSFDYANKTTAAFDYGTKTSSSFDYGTKTAASNGAHTHNLIGNSNKNGMEKSGPLSNGVQGLYSGDAQSNEVSGKVSSSGAHTHSVAIGAHTHTVGIGSHTHTVSIGAHTHTVALGSHSHTVSIGSHTHTITGTIGSSGSGTEFDIRNSFIKLMGWYRVA